MFAGPLVTGAIVAITRTVYKAFSPNPESTQLQFETLDNDEFQIEPEKILGLWVFPWEPTKMGYNVGQRRKLYPTLKLSQMTFLSKSCWNLVGVKFTLSICNSQMLSQQGQTFDLILRRLRRLKCQIQFLASNEAKKTSHHCSLAPATPPAPAGSGNFLDNWIECSYLNLLQGSWTWWLWKCENFRQTGYLA